MRVSQCVCHDISFESLRELAARENLTLDQLMEKAICSKGCGLCRPYIQLMLATGQTSFPALHPDTVELMVADSLKRGGPEADLEEVEPEPVVLQFHEARARHSPGT